MIRATLAQLYGVEVICDLQGNPIVWPPPEAIYVSRDEQGPFALMPGEEALVPPPVVVDTLEVVKLKACAYIDQIAESYRAYAITLLPGQIAEYAYTEEEARAFLADPTQPLEKFPYLYAEWLSQKDDGLILTAQQLIDLVAYEITACRQFGALIKRPRRSAKIKIDNATSVEEIQAIIESIDTWPEVF